MSAADRPHLLSLTHDDLVAELVALGQPAYRAKQVLQWRYKHRVNEWERMTDLPAPLRATLTKKFTLSSIEMVRRLGSNDTTQKFLFPPAISS